MVIGNGFTMINIGAMKMNNERHACQLTGFCYRCAYHTIFGKNGINFLGNEVIAQGECPNPDIFAFKNPFLNKIT